MPVSLHRAACVCLLALASATLCMADSLASSASNAGSSAVGSLSDSIQGSSNSSAGDKRVAEGDYRVIEVAEAEQRPGMMRLRLRANAPAAGDAAIEFTLDVPRQTLDTAPLAPSDLVTARHRPYGVEFVRTATREPFFLAVADDWMHEFAAHAVKL